MLLSVCKQKKANVEGRFRELLLPAKMESQVSDLLLCVKQPKVDKMNETIICNILDFRQ